MSVEKLKIKMQKFANDPTYNSALVCFIVDGSRVTALTATDMAGEDGLMKGDNASIAANTVLPVIETISKQLKAGIIQEAQFLLEKAFLTLRMVETSVRIQNSQYVKKCLFAFLYTGQKTLTTHEHSQHLSFIDLVMADQKELTENGDGSSTIRTVDGLESLLKKALEEYYNPR